MKLVTICLLWLAILVGHSAAQEDTEDEIIKFRDFKVQIGPFSLKFFVVFEIEFWSS